VKTRRDPVFGCVLHEGRKDKDGYGMEGRQRAHIIAWTEAFGPVPEGFELDHQCAVRRCVALHHLEPVTRSEQEKRKSFKYRLRRTRCAKGHDMVINRVVIPQSRGVVCRACNDEAKGRMR
jgi:hypothetical protein